MDTETAMGRVKLSSYMCRFAEVGLWLVGISLLCLWGSQMLRQGPLAERQTDLFLARAQAATADPNTQPQPSLNHPDTIDTSLWSAKRIEQFGAIEQSKDDIIAVLKIDSLGLSAPIFTEPTDNNLNRGLGWLDKTAPVTGGGNTAIAGHRDSFFRVLKDIQIGDRIAVTTLEGEKSYTVTELQIVLPSNVSVLAPTDHNQLTLITCYPFYHVGSAPERFIVTATENSPATLH
ncbi:class D sortase [Gilvimarinus chinensis]|uniref:class D sortase n=1 Tax=Gilvimarinus chinensis TaxID=396005 RepID=UPI00036EE1F3|nr:class D sortase [Gilvimarinus chinensis]